MLGKVTDSGGIIASFRESRGDGLVRRAGRYVPLYFVLFAFSGYPSAYPALFPGWALVGGPKDFATVTSNVRDVDFAFFLPPEESAVVSATSSIRRYYHPDP